MITDLLKSNLYRIGLRASPSLLFRLQHLRLHLRFSSHWYWPNLRNPLTFNEYLLRSKVDERHRHLSYLVDKGEVKDWVAKRIGRRHVVPTIGIFDSPKSVPVHELPRPCILKPTHLSGHVIILFGGEDDPDSEKIKHQLDRWQRVNHYSLSGEAQYCDIRPRIICEPLLGNAEEDLPDFKFFCFHGEPTYIQVDSDRRGNHVRSFYDTHWRLQPFRLRYPPAPTESPRPGPLVKMIQIARTLAQGFDFVRVDLYWTGEEIFFGELTFHPESGCAPFSDYKTDLMFGEGIRGGVT